MSQPSFVSKTRHIDALSSRNARASTSLWSQYKSTPRTRAPKRTASQCRRAGWGQQHLPSVKPSVWYFAVSQSSATTQEPGAGLCPLTCTNAQALKRTPYVVVLRANLTIRLFAGPRAASAPVSSTKSKRVMGVLPLAEVIALHLLSPAGAQRHTHTDRLQHL